MLSLIAATLFAAPKGTVVMIHGAGGGGWEYDKWKPVFEKARWKVVNKDLVPAKGGYAETTIVDYVDQVASWTPKAGRVVYIGASMGGALALKTSEFVPIDALVLVNSVAPKGVGPRRESKPNPPVVKWANGPLKDTEDAMPDSDRKTILWAWKRWRDESGHVMDALRAGVDCKKPKVPTLVVLGEADTDIPHATGLALAKWAKADVKSYPKMSHVGPLLSKSATKVATYVVEWLNKKIR